MRIFISVDIEGIVGVASRDQTRESGFEYQRARLWMTETARACALAAHEAGATEVVIADSHGNAQNLLIELFPPFVQIVRAWPRPLSVMQGIDRGRYDGAIFLGYHTEAGNPEGGLAHSFLSMAVRRIAVNGVAFSETAIGAAIAGEFGVPVLMASGDDAYCAEVCREIGPVETAAVKTAFGNNSTMTLTPEAAYALVAEATTRAIAGRAKRQPFTVPGPFDLDVTFKHRLPAQYWTYTRFVTRLDAFTIRYRAESMVDAAGFLTFLFGYSADLS